MGRINHKTESSGETWWGNAWITVPVGYYGRPRSVYKTTRRSQKNSDESHETSYGYDDMNRDFLAMLIKNGPDTFRVLKYWNAETALISRWDTSTETPLIWKTATWFIDTWWTETQCCLTDSRPSIGVRWCHIAKIMKNVQVQCGGDKAV
jgi:hypothetical protein